MSMIHSHFSTRKPVRNENYRGVGHAADRFVGAIARRFSCYFLLSRFCRSLFEVRNTRTKALSKTRMKPSFEDTLPLKNIIPRVSPTEREVCRGGVETISIPWRALACLHQVFSIVTKTLD